MHTRSRPPLALLVAATLGFAPTLASAALVNFGDVSDPAGDVTFEDVTEDNNLPTTVFAPEAVGPTAVGNTLVLDPTGFQSQSSGGMADLIDSELSTTIVADPGAVITSFTINEFGAYSLGGLSDGEAMAEVNAAIFVTGATIGGVPTVLPAIQVPFVATDGGSYERPDDDGTAVAWTGSAIFDVATGLAGVGLAGEVTSLDIVFDNALLTAADDVSVAFIDKKGVTITVETDPHIPEPATLGLVALGLAGVTVRGKRRR